MAKKVLITGAAGFVGSHLLASIQDFECSALKGDLLDFASLQDQILEFKPDVILHLAAISLPAQCDEDPARAFSVNVAGTALLCEAMLKTKLKAHLIFSSTAQVYAPLEKGTDSVIHESSAILPLNLYARTKRMAEVLIEQYCSQSGLSATILRFFNHVHHSQRSGTFLSSLLKEIQSRRMESGPKIVPVGNLELMRDMGSIEDLISAIIAMINDVEHFKPSSCEIFNVCNGKARKLRHLANLLASELKVEVEFFQDPARIRENDPPVMIGSFAKFNARTGWKPKVESDEALIQSFLSN